MSARTQFAIAALAAAVLAAQPAIADVGVTEYRGCDGYGAAASGGDGMTEQATVWGIFSKPGGGDTDQKSAAPGPEGVADCDAALGDLPKKQWLRRVNLLRGRALHHLEGNDTAAALADLDQAKAAAENPNDPYYARSLGLGVDLLRAYVLRHAGDQPGGDALAVASLVRRPYSRLVPIAGLMAMGPSASSVDIQRALESLARLDPRNIDRVFIRDFESGRFADAVALYPQLLPPREPGDEELSPSMQAALADRNLRMEVSLRVSRAAVYAYALAALGRGGEATAAIAAEQSRIDSGLEDRASMDARREFSLLALMVKLRLKIAQGDIANVTRDLPPGTLPRSWASVDFIDALIAKMPPKQRPKVSPTAALKVKVAADLNSDIPVDDLKTLFVSLPEAEIPDRVPPYAAADGSDRNEEGYRVANNADGTTTITTRGLKSTTSLVEEMALLRAAELARAAGKKSFIIVDRTDTKFHINYQSYGQTVSTAPDGFSSELKVMFMDPGVSVAGYMPPAWRVFDADTVYADLAPLYIRTKR